MNRGLNLPQIQRIMMEFERESATMDMKEEMMSDAVDDVMDDELEDEEEEGDKILKQVLDEIGVDLSQQVCLHHPIRLPASHPTVDPAFRDSKWPCDIFTTYRTSSSGRRRRSLRKFCSDRWKSA